MVILISIALYTASWTYLLLGALRKVTIQRRIIFALLYPAIMIHAVLAIGNMRTPEGFNFGVLHIASMLFMVINMLVCLSSLRKPLENLFLLLIPLTLTIMISSSFSTDTTITKAALGIPIITHILLSVLAHSLLAIATLQALLLSYQYKKLKTRHPKGLIGILPPLQTMETLMFELVWAGFALLTASILSGLIYLDNIFAQHLAHKTVFSIFAWFIYATLLWGRHSIGWRGIIAIRWVLVGFVALMLAYFGSKIVLEVILTS